MGDGVGAVGEEGPISKTYEDLFVRVRAMCLDAVIQGKVGNGGCSANICASLWSTLRAGILCDRQTWQGHCPLYRKFELQEPDVSQ